MDTSVLKNVLLLIVANIDAGYCNMTDADMTNVMDFLQKVMNPGDVLSKYQVAQRLNCSEKTVDNLIRAGKLPAGKKIAGITAKLWFKQDIDAYLTAQNDI